MNGARCRRRVVRLLAAASAGCLAAGGPPAALAQSVDLGLGGETGLTTPAAPSETGGLNAGSLMPSAPPQPGNFATSPVPLPMQGGQSLSDRLAGALGKPSVTAPGAPAFQVTPSIGVQQGWTSNVFNYPGLPVESAFFTGINPAVTVTADTQRLQLNATYDPNLILYEPSHGQNVVAQNLNAQAHSTVVQDMFYVDLSAFAAQTSLAGGYGPPGTALPNQVGSTQDYSVSLSPYLMHQFGSVGTAQVGVMVNESAMIVPAGSTQPFAPGLAAAALPSAQATTLGEFINLISGEDFGRLLSIVNASGEQSRGTGVLGNGYQYSVSYQGQYAVTHSFSLLGTIGWQSLHYSGFPPVTITGLLWNVGAQFTPSPDASLTVRYGRTDGINGAFVSGNYAPTARTLLTINYSVTVTTDQQQLQAALPLATTDAAGNLVNAQTGSPLLQNNNFLGFNPGVYQLQSGSLTASLLLDRDTFQIAGNQLRETPLNSATAGALLTGENATFGSLTWQHDLSPAVKTSLMAQYGVSQFALANLNVSGTVFVASAMVSYALSPTLTTTLQYSHAMDNFHGQVPGFTTDMVIAGLQKSF